jgi:hypothetical protein
MILWSVKVVSHMEPTRVIVIEGLHTANPVVKRPAFMKLPKGVLLYPEVFKGENILFTNPVVNQEEYKKYEEAIMKFTMPHGNPYEFRRIHQSDEVVINHARLNEERTLEARARNAAKAARIAEERELERKSSQYARERDVEFQRRMQAARERDAEVRAYNMLCGKNWPVHDYRNGRILENARDSF